MHLVDVPNNQRRGETSQQGRDRNSRSIGGQAFVNAPGITGQAPQPGRSGRRVTPVDSGESQARGKPGKGNRKNDSHALDNTRNEAAGRNAQQQEKGSDLDPTQRFEVLQTLDGFARQIEDLRQQLMPASYAMEEELKEKPREGPGGKRKGR